MKKIILAAAAVALTAGAAYAQPLNSNGERKSDYASILQAGGTTQAQGQQGLIDYTATASIGGDAQRVRFVDNNGERKSDYASIVAAGGSTAAQGNVPLATVSLDKGFVLNSRGERSYVGQAVR